MKTIKSIIVIVLIGIISVVQAQKVFKVSDVVNGKTFLQHAQKIDVDAFFQTKAIYKAGMTEATFVKELEDNFPSKATQLKPIFVPYLKYIYSLHKNGFTENQIKGRTTGNEFTALCTELKIWNSNNPEILPETLKLPWRKILEFILEIIPIILKIF